MLLANPKMLGNKLDKSEEKRWQKIGGEESTITPFIRHRVSRQKAGLTTREPHQHRSAW